MRALIVIVALILILALVGWITFSKGPDRASIDLETGKIRQDTQHAMQSGAELLHKAGDKMATEANRPTTEAERNRQTEPTAR